ncbi:DUF5996 family protein [Candidatus Leptofilum sp.]|uniref:DUF5996 family protein n=1 Tax=Candidatus Leptofilum sp. TaxID=3241576 RepID=UPI003B5CE1F5
MSFFEPLTDFEPTRQTLHLYSHALGVVPRAHGIAHPKWWHISLKPRPDGLTSDNIPLPNGGVLALRLDFHQHQLVLETSSGQTQSMSLQDGMTGTEMGEWVITAVAQHGITGDFAREKFESDEPREYDAAQAVRFFGVLSNVARTFEKHRAKLEGVVSPVQVWPHGFDIAFDWFGSRVERAEEHGKMQEFPAQLNLGFYPGGDPYFYSNPWPFEADALLGKPLPHGAVWHTDGWQGTKLPYSNLVNQPEPDAETKLLEYAQAVYDLAAPTLMA